MRKGGISELEGGGGEKSFQGLHKEAPEKRPMYERICKWVNN